MSVKGGSVSCSINGVVVATYDKAAVVTAEQLKVAEKEKGRFGGEVLATLFALGLVNPGLVFPVLSQRAAALLLRAFLAPTGVFEYQPLELGSST